MLCVYACVCVTVTTTAISGCGKLLASGADNGEVLVWDLATSKCLYILNGHAGAVHSVDFRYVYVFMCLTFVRAPGYAF